MNVHYKDYLRQWRLWLSFLIMFPAPISFLNDELKAELGMKLKKEEEEDEAKFCSLKVPMDHEDKESKTYVVKVKTYDSGTPEEFFRWRLILNEQMKNHGYSANYDMVMNLAQVMLAGTVWKRFLMNDGHKKQKTKRARRRTRRCIPPNKFMIAQFLNWQSVLLTSRVDG
jgi:hypothetical protein